jgi:protein-disulfide isomerase
MNKFKGVIMIKKQKANNERIKKESEKTGEPGEPSNSYIIYILVGLLLISGYLIWNLSSKVNKMEVKSSQLKTTQVPEQKQVEQPTNVQPVELKISDNDPSLGSKKAKVTVVIFSDFICPFCAALSGESKSMVDSMKGRFGNSWEPAMPNIIKEYVNTNLVRLVWKDAPYHGDQAVQVHSAARCANDQGKFWEFHNLVFSKLGENQGEYNKESLKKLGIELKLNSEEFNKCIDNDKYVQNMRDAAGYAQSVGAGGTPTTFINGKVISGAQPFSQFKVIIDEEVMKNK